MFEVRPNPNALTASQTEEKDTQNFEMQQFYLLEKKNAPSKRHEISLTFTLFRIALSRLVFLLLNYYYKILNDHYISDADSVGGSFFSCR